MNREDSTLTELQQQISQNCTQCGVCVAKCSYLRQHGDPKQLADSYDSSQDSCHSRPFECSLCELCTAVCPQQLNPAQLFLEMRRSAFQQGKANLPQHKSLRNFEKIGTSKQFSGCSLPSNCDSVFFPGCALSGSRPDTTRKLYSHLQQQIPGIGIVFDCCTKPSHDLGNQQRFSEMFGALKHSLLQAGIKTVLVACPNCYKVFNEYAPELQTRTVYEQLELQPLPETPRLTGKVSVHDPCVARFVPEAQQAVRSLLDKAGLSIVETRHTGKKTLCCGLGGGVNSLDSDKAERWLSQRVSESDGQPLVSYCAACTERLGKMAPAHHLLDLLFDSKRDIHTGSGSTKAPFTYLNRLMLKRSVKQLSPATFSCIRDNNGENPPSRLKKAVVLVLALALFMVLRQFGIPGY